MTLKRCPDCGLPMQMIEVQANREVWACPVCDYDDGTGDDDMLGGYVGDPPEEPDCPLCHDLYGNIFDDGATRCPLCGR